MIKLVMNILVGAVIGFAGGILWAERPSLIPVSVPVAEEQEIQPLNKYSIENLGKREYKSELIWDEIIATQSGFLVQKFHFDSDGEKISGLAHLPKTCTICPVIVQVRGYAAAEYYQSGYGTRRSAEKFAQAGFVSLAPDFLGYGDSAPAAADVFEARFKTYTTVLNLLAGVGRWEKANGKIGIWGHSNGGQIALTVLEISRADHPTVLWAPVTAGFPYSVLYYMNDNEDGDKILRKKLTDFEEIYDSRLFNLQNYTDRITAKLQLHQGTADESVPVDWARDFVQRLKGSEKEVRYFEYPGADHNLVPEWSRVVQRDIEFFRTSFDGMQTIGNTQSTI